MAYWWNGRPEERYWVEIRRLPGLGVSLHSPVADQQGAENPWYSLLATVASGDVIYHYNARESRFVGRSIAASAAQVDRRADTIDVPLRDFVPIVAPVDLAILRHRADDIYNLRDALARQHDGALYLPFQFTKERNQFRMMSNYFAKMPADLVRLLFGEDGLAQEQVPLAPAAVDEPEVEGAPEPEPGVGGFLDPFKAKADTDYMVDVLGGRRRRTRRHESLVNSCAAWLSKQGFAAGRNAAIDLGTLEPPVIFEAKMIVGEAWSTPIRQAVGQLYEYRYFKVARPDAALIFLANSPVPGRWVRYLELDRGIGCIWPDPQSGYSLSDMSRRALDL